MDIKISEARGKFVKKVLDISEKHAYNTNIDRRSVGNKETKGGRE